MNKFVAFGVAVVLCAVAAGFGAYLAMRPQPASVAAPAAPGPAVPAADATVTRAAQSPQEAAAAPATRTPAEETRPGSPAAATAPAARESSRKPVASEPSRPQPETSASAGAGAAAAATPASENPAAVGMDRPVQGGAVGAAALPPAAPAPPPVVEPPAPPQKTFEELVVSADSVIGIRIDSTISSEVARVEDPVEARVTRDVRVGEDVAIPSGTRAIGSVIQAERGGKMKTAARIGVRFHTLVLADGTRLSINSEAIYREGASPGKESAAKVGAATAGGAILGAIIGGGKGAAIGGAVGAAGGTGAVMAGGRNPAVINSGTSITVRLRQPFTVTIERNELRN